MQPVFPNLHYAISYAISELQRFGIEEHPHKWQGVEAPQPMIEYDNLFFRAKMPGLRDVLQRQTKATQPWAEDHFLERVSGKPLNPGEQYKNWPFYGNKKWADAQFRNVKEKFTHTYMERYWPKFAGADWGQEPCAPVMGLWYEYGDLDDVITLLEKDPTGRQAYLPVWFPEDTGVKHGGRVPCTIGYHFIMRDSQLHVHYLIRSCDAKRHFRNDVYLTTRLGQYILDRLRERNAAWGNVEMGILTMNIINFHCFKLEINQI